MTGVSDRVLNSATWLEIGVRRRRSRWLGRDEWIFNIRVFELREATGVPHLCGRR